METIFFLYDKNLKRHKDYWSPCIICGVCALYYVRFYVLYNIGLL
jgi:hypothetical protein